MTARHISRTRTLNMTTAYVVGTIGLVTALGVSSALAARDDTASDANKTKAAVDLRNEQRSTSMDSIERHAAPAEDRRTSESTNYSQTTMTVNGQTVDVPENGTLHRTMTDSDGTTQVDVSVENHSSDTSSDQTSQRTQQRMRLDVNTQSSTTTRGSGSMHIKNSE